MIDAEVRKVNGFVSADANGIKVNVTGKGYPPSAPYFQTNTVIPKPTFMSFVKGNMKTLAKRSPYYMGWAAAMAAAGWAFDELTGEATVSTGVAIDGKGSCSVWQNASGTLYKSFDLAMSSALCIQMVKEYKYFYSYWNRDVSPFTSATNSFSNKPIQGSGYVVYISPLPVTNAPFTGTFYVAFRPIEGYAPIPQTSPVSDSTLYDSLVSHMISNPTGAADAFMTPGANPYPYPQLFPNPLKYIPGVSEADYPLLDCYFNGTLQSTNPGAACYATQAESDRIKVLGDQIKVNTSTGGQIEQANDELTKPLTQAQLEESLNKLEGADVNKVTDDASKIYDEGFKQLNDSIVGDSLPGMPDLIPIPQFHTGTCRSIPLNFNLAGVSVIKQFPGETGCAQFEKMKEFLGWLMAVGVAIGLMFAALREAN